MNDAVKVERVVKKTYIVAEKEIPNHVDNVDVYAEDKVITNDVVDVDVRLESSETESLQSEKVELCSGCREPTDRTVPLESGHDAPFCEECEEKLGDEV